MSDLNEKDIRALEAVHAAALVGEVYTQIGSKRDRPTARQLDREPVYKQYITPARLEKLAEAGLIEVASVSVSPWKHGDWRGGSFIQAKPTAEGRRVLIEYRRQEGDRARSTSE